MKISASKINNLISNNNVSTTYRVNNSYENRGIESDRYKYYSLTNNHHIYFLVKKIFRLIESEYDISINNPRDRYLSNKINEVINYLEHDDILIVSKDYIIDKDFSDLLLNNAYSNKSTHRENVIEIVDKNKYGGGIGLKGLWLDLYDILTFCEKEQILSSREVINYLELLRDLIDSYGKEALKQYKLQSGILLLNDKTSYIVKDHVLTNQSDLIKEKLDGILSEDLAHSKSLLKKNPIETIDRFINNYNNNRLQLLKSIKK